MNYDPKLKECLARIEKLCEEYDCGAWVSLVSKTHGEFRYVIPKWSAIYEERDPMGETIGLRIKTVNMKNDPLEKIKGDLASHFIFSQRDIAAQAFRMFDHLCNLVQTKWNVEHKPFANYRPHRKDEN